MMMEAQVLKDVMCVELSLKIVWDQWDNWPQHTSLCVATWRFDAVSYWTSMAAE